MLWRLAVDGGVLVLCTCVHTDGFFRRLYIDEDKCTGTEMYFRYIDRDTHTSSNRVNSLKQPTLEMFSIETRINYSIGLACLNV